MNRRPKRKRSRRNVFDIVQFKRLVGKKMIRPHCNTVVDKKNMARQIAVIKQKILSKSIKTIAVTFKMQEN